MEDSGVFRGGAIGRSLPPAGLFSGTISAGKFEHSSTDLADMLSFFSESLTYNLERRYFSD